MARLNKVNDYPEYWYENIPDFGYVKFRLVDNIRSKYTQAVVYQSEGDSDRFFLLVSYWTGIEVFDDITKRWCRLWHCWSATTNQHEHYFRRWLWNNDYDTQPEFHIDGEKILSCRKGCFDDSVWKPDDYSYPRKSDEWTKFTPLDWHEYSTYNFDVFVRDFVDWNTSPKVKYMYRVEKRCKGEDWAVLHNANDNNNGLWTLLGYYKKLPDAVKVVRDDAAFQLTMKTMGG